MDASGVSVTGLTLISNGAPSGKGHVCIARFDTEVPGVQIRGCSLMISGTSGKPYWSASSPRRFSSAYVNDKGLYHGVLNAALTAYHGLGGRQLTPAQVTTGMPAAIARMCDNSATGAWDGAL